MRTRTFDDFERLERTHARRDADAEGERIAKLARTMQPVDALLTSQAEDLYLQGWWGDQDEERGGE